MLPILKSLEDGSVYSMGEVIQRCSDYLNLPDSLRNELLPSGKQKKFDNRIHWAKKYLLEAGLLENPKRGQIKITGRGLEVLGSNPDIIDVNYLKQFPEFQKFGNNKDRNSKQGVSEDSVQSVYTPREVLDNSYNEIRKSLSIELLEKVKSCSPYFFEQLVIDLLVSMGYGGSLHGSAEVTCKTGDGGIDGLIKEDKLGLEVIYVQAKRWKNVVGRPEIQSFVGSLAGMQSKKGIFITTSGFTKNACDYAEKVEQKIILIDGSELAGYMVDYDIGVSEEDRYVVKRIDYDYFEES
ncbi:restriction endonuclease [Methanoplanus endosymbiosus]|uniref:Restriction endonuclease n=1 Tax=Methanoplanus endosymbiosus TaxID=33865 RepID=A0A9E7PMH8_9EURY|nr:restriction endonuclease [Methanoplanus endosymbiosus]UUX91616.1 restriction endonuclease [Methanoplanus endosymbiosus]